MYIGEVGKRYEMTLTLKKRFSFPVTIGWKTEDMYIYSFEDADSNVYIWKTTASMGMDKEVPIKNGDSRWEYDFVNNGDTAVVKATVKEHSEYKGIEQTVLSRVTVKSISHVPTKYEINEQRRIEQLKTLAEGDFVWHMPYRQYKSHYADCETLANSYSREDATIGVIIRNGRLVNSGVRGKHFGGYVFTVDGKNVSYRAVSWENAEKRCRADFPDSVIESYTVYR